MTILLEVIDIVGFDSKYLFRTCILYGTVFTPE